MTCFSYICEKILCKKYIYLMYGFVNILGFIFVLVKQPYAHDNVSYIGNIIFAPLTLRVWTYISHSKKPLPGLFNVIVIYRFN